MGPQDFCSYPNTNSHHGHSTVLDSQILWDYCKALKIHTVILLVSKNTERRNCIEQRKDTTPEFMASQNETESTEK